MPGTLTRQFFAAAVLALLSLGAVAEPTLKQVYAIAESGNVAGAEKMMQEVLKSHPDAAKAHFVHAELLAKLGRGTEAGSELATAEKLAPGLPFAKPESVDLLRAMVSPAATKAPSTGGGQHQLLYLGGALLLGFGLFSLASRLLRRPQYAPAAPGAVAGGYGPAYGGQPYGQTYGGPPTGPGIGGSVLGGLATGAAIGAGVVAGEALMHRVLDGGREDLRPEGSLPQDSVVNFEDEPTRAAGYDMGGSNFGVSDTSSWEDDDSGSDGGSWDDDSGDDQI